MPRVKTEYEKLAGKLISEIQKVWGELEGESGAGPAEEVMDLAHDLLQARSPEGARTLLGGRTVRQFLGTAWLKDFPQLDPLVIRLQAQIT